MCNIIINLIISLAISVAIIITFIYGVVLVEIIKTSKIYTTMRKFNMELTLRELNELYFILSSSKTKAMIELKKNKDNKEIVSQLNEMLESYNSMLAKVEEKISRK